MHVVFEQRSGHQQAYNLHRTDAENILHLNDRQLLAQYALKEMNSHDH